MTKKNIKISLGTLGVLFLIAAFSLLYMYMHNFRTVIPHQVYRSRQLGKQEFINVIHHYKIKSILNLRGAHPKKHWYQLEMQAVKLTGVKHYDLALKSKTLPSTEQLIKLVNIIDTAPRPLLIHCLSGVDRSGLGSSIALILDNAPMGKVEEQESVYYFVFSHQSVGKQMLRRYNAWLIKNHKKTSKDNFMQWLNSLPEKR